MTDSAQKIFFANSAFRFSSSACDCEVDITHPSKGVTMHTYRLYPKEDMLYYAYIAEDGLVSKKRNGAAEGRPVLRDLLAIKDEDSKAVKAFIEKHGFFLQLDPSKNNSVESDFLFGMINQLKATVSLMSALGEGTIDYKKVIALTMYLLFTPQTSINFNDSANGPFYTYPHEVGRIWQNIKSISELARQVEDEPNKGFYINDSVRPPITFLGMGEYDDAIGYGEYDFSNARNKLIYLFRNAVKVSLHCRLAIDFLYHFHKDVGNIQSFNHKGELTFTESSPNTPVRFKSKFDNQLQTALLALAKHTLKKQIEDNLDGIKPSYDTELMAPSWHVDKLLSGLYFSIFYMRPEIELYRVCANPNCGLSFLVPTTSHKKKYCNTSCANAMAQRNYRRRKMDGNQIANN